MKFFFDNCMSPHHAVGIRGFAEIQRHEIRHLRERFDEDTRDVEWITALGKESSWIVISGDMRITRNPVERRAWHESGLTAFFFSHGWSESSYWNKAADLVHWWPDIAQTARDHPERHGFVIPKSGRKLTQIYPA